MDRIYDKLCDMLDEVEQKRTFTLSDLQVVDLATHAKKSILCIWKMEDEMGGQAFDDGGSYDGSSYENSSYRRSYNSYGSYDGGSMRGMSNRRSRAMRRDSMGRYAREGSSYSRADFREELQQLMKKAPDDNTRQNIERMMQELDN